MAKARFWQVPWLVLLALHSGQSHLEIRIQNAALALSQSMEVKQCSSGEFPGFLTVVGNVGGEEGEG